MESAKGTLMEPWTTRRAILRDLGAVATIAFVTALLRATSDIWRPLLALTMGRWAGIYFVGFLAFSLFVALLRLVDRQLRWSRAEVGVVVVAGLLIGFVAGGLLWGDKDRRIPAFMRYACETHLAEMAMADIVSADVGGGLMGTTVGVVEEESVRVAARRLRWALVEAYRDRLLRHFITVGGPDVERVDRVLRRAVWLLPKYHGGGIEIVLVTPEPIPDHTVKRLQGKGLKVEQVEYKPTFDLPDARSGRGEAPGRPRARMIRADSMQDRAVRKR